jgi:dTDP-4-dehydrorhamnose 3,5-epimerase-like enzyme
MKPELLNGGNHRDSRGIIRYNNDFDSSFVKRMYVIENVDTLFVRGWQGHKFEQRWFTVMQGSFKIELIAIDDWENPCKRMEVDSFFIDAEKLDVLHVPKGYVSSIQALSVGSKLLAMSDYWLNEISDEYRFPLDYFE